jgi:beta-phosphoglucomutase-like phosphatase (HAD superfamily)
VLDGAYVLVIFDCDGVLVESERIAVRVSARGLTERG